MLHYDGIDGSKVGSNFTSLAVILSELILKKGENYYLQMFLKEFKYIEKEKERESGKSDKK